MGSGASARKRSRSSNSLYGIGADVSAHLRSKETPGHNRIVLLISEILVFLPAFDGELRRLIQNILESDSCKGGGGGNRTRVRERSARESTYLSGSSLSRAPA